MTRVLPRARLHSSELLRFLASQGMVDATADMGDVGQRLGDWLNFRQAIALQGFIGTVDDPDAPQAAPSARVDADVLRRRFSEVRLALEQSIVKGSVPALGLVRIEMPAAELDHPIDPKTAFDPLRRFAAGHQRQMDTIIRSLRMQLRGMLDKGTTQDRQLSTLDAIFENVLSTREARLLGKIPAEFEKRFAKLLKQHMKQLLQAAEADEPAPLTEPWLAPLCTDLRAALLAELDLRLQPILGLIEAITQDKPQQQ
ncbi:MAG: DUF3348 family protein [Limnohabitans sp.]|nr:MAG: DUF3348 family protein [Limnohabitans sp.]